MLSSLQSGDQDLDFQESETTVTSRTERTAGSGLTSGLTMTSERMLTDKLAEAMGIQVRIKKCLGLPIVLNKSNFQFLIIESVCYT